MMRRKSVLLAIAAVLIAVAVGAYVWLIVLGGRGLVPQTSATVDGAVEYASDGQVQAALQKLEQGCDQAEVIHSDPTQWEKTVAIAFIGLSSPSVNDKIIRLLEVYDQQATFFVSGVEGAENEDFLQQLRSEGHGLGSSGLKGESRAEEKTRADLVSEFVRSGRVLRSLTDSAVELLYCPNSIYTPQVLQAAMASGYDRVVEPEDALVLDYATFSSEEEVGAFVSTLEQGSLLMIVTDGQNDEIPDEPPVEPDRPAIDMQPNLDAEGESIAEDVAENAVELTRWLLRAMREQNVRTVPVDSLAAQPGSAVATPEKKSVVYTSFLTERQAVGLALYGLSDTTALEQAQALLRQYGAQATFYATESETLACREDLSALAANGFQLGNGGSGNSRHQTLETIYQDILSCAEALEDITDVKTMTYLPVGLLPLGPAYEEDAIRQAAGASGYTLIAPENPEQLQAGALYGFDLSGKDAMERLERLLASAARERLDVRDVGQMLEDSGSVPTFTAAEMRALRQENDGAMAEENTFIQTTEAALSFVFYGVSNEPAIADIMDRLDDYGASGTFFVTLNELQSCQERIEALLAAGHEVQIAYVVNSAYPDEFDAVVRYLSSCRYYMRWRFGVEPDIVLLPFAEASEEVREAASAMGFSVVGRTYTIVRSQDQDITLREVKATLEDVLSSVSLSRGALVYFNTNFYQQDKDLPADYRGQTVCGSMVAAVLSSYVDAIAYTNPETNEIEPDSRYAVKTCGALMDSPLCYTLPADTTQDDVSDDNHLLAELETDKELFAYINEHYVGTPAANTWRELPGFAVDERVKLDKRGIVKEGVEDNVLFLTFDDWGTDAAINKLLYVLEKHDVKATFFIRSNYVDYNPNLLRAIAEAGHEIASHSYNHLPLSDYVEADNRYLSLTEEEQAALREDLVMSYQALYDIVGDVTVNGKSALSRNFRPPTLAVSKEGLMQVLDVGFTNVVSGNFSTHDYEAESVEALVSQFETGFWSYDVRVSIQGGACVVMHMSDESMYTAQALDIMIPIWKEQGYTFARVDDYLN